MGQNASFLARLGILYAALALVLAAGFDVDIFSWWATPAFDAVSALLHHIQAFFRID